MDKAESTNKSSIWHFSPKLPIKGAPYFDRPNKPFKSLLYLLRSWNPLGQRCLFLILALIVWTWFTPSLERAQAFTFDWILEVWLRNLVLLLIIAGGLHLYLIKHKKQGDDYRYDKTPMLKAKVFTFGNQVYDNMFWTLGPALFFWTFWESLMYWSYANGYIAMISFDSSPEWFVVLILLIPLYAGFFFYWQHRLLHTPFLYKKVHTLHHRNGNTGPWSGLAMHPVESFILMSDVLIFFLISSHPIHMIFLIFHHGIGAPTSHTGFEHVKIGSKGKLSLGDFFHQLHHKFFDCNYGTWETPWDQWFKTFHDGTDKGTQLIAKRRMALKGQK